MSDIEKEGSAVHQETVTNNIKEPQTVIQPDIEKKKNGAIKQHILDWKHSIFRKPDKPVNMWHLLTNLNNKQRITFTAAFLGWMLDAFDFFSVSLTTTYIAEDFGVPVSDVTSAITTTLMLRPIGALVFGALADRYGRRWPLMIDIVLFSIINMASGFAPNLQTFIGLRAVFGICMGGEWGLGASLALESLPIEARGLFSGIFQEGYACGYLLATLINYAIQSRGGSWRILFWVGAAFALLAVVIRFWVPESESFKETQKARKMLNRSVWKEALLAVKKHWLRLIYMIIFAAFFNFFSHGSQDLYPTFLTTQLGYSEEEKTVTSVIYNIGAIVGGILFGYLSNYLGRRFVVVICSIGAGAFIALWAFGPSIQSLQFGSFMMQFFVQGGWGVVPAYLNEISPPGFRGLMPGLAYQLGNLVSAASSQIEATIGERYPLRNEDGSLKLNSKGQPIADYALTQAIFMGCVCGCLLITALCGKEEINKDFMEHLVEDENSPNTVGIAEIQDDQMEQATGSQSEKREITHNEEPLKAEGDSDSVSKRD
ncbi:major facilitator superfamily domain-containing protein [Absidia repens]|uniref:Major facilitator superfamily domain-containing protein n=1 Tax=Absidia repens TaxID=90262 RepID=A0A1X2IET6_9FUNG|nr:major facilitator superfamily domain-containing protein [Absidia repens]